MEKKTQQGKNAGPSDCQNLCCDKHPSGRFSKASIGIMIEKHPNIGSLESKGVAVTLPKRVMLSSCLENVVDKRKAHGTEESKGLHIVDNHEVTQKVSASFASRFVRPETPSAETTHFYDNLEPIVQSGHGVDKDLATLIYEKRKEKGENFGTVQVEEVIFSTKKDAQYPDKGDGKEPEEVTECNNGALKMNLSEILGTDPSQNKPNLNASNTNREEYSKVNQGLDTRRDKVSQLKHSSDTIDMDPESPNHMIKRPITCSLTRKRLLSNTVSKTQLGINLRKELLSIPASAYKLKLQEKNIFSFDEEGDMGGLKKPTIGYSDTFKRKKNERKMARTKPHIVYYRKSLLPQKGQRPSGREQTALSHDKVSLNNKETGGSPGAPCCGRSDLQMPHILKGITRPQRICSPVKPATDKKLQHYEWEQIPPSPEKSSVQRHETGDSPSTPCQGQKDFNRTSGLEKTTKIFSQGKYSAGEFISEKKRQPHERTLPSPHRASSQTKGIPNDGHYSQPDAQKDFERQPFPHIADTNDILDGPLLRKKGYLWENVVSPLVSKDLYKEGTNPPMERKRDQSYDFSSPTSVMKIASSSQEVASPPLQREPDLFNDFPNPTFAKNATSLSPCSNELSNGIFSCPLLTQLRTLTRKCNSSKLSDKPGSASCGSDASIISSESLPFLKEGTGYTSKSQETEHMKWKETRKKSSLSSAEDLDTQRPEADDFTIRGHKTAPDFRQSNRLFSDADTLDESPSKRHRCMHFGKNGVTNSGLRQAENCSSHSGSGKISQSIPHQSKMVNTKPRTEETVVSPKSLEQCLENNWESEVAELTLVLERFKDKLKSHNSKESSEILSSASEKIRLQLQDLESQMQQNTEKLITTGTSKRKHIDSRLQGAQEKLSLIFQKFKEDANYQLQDCINTLEELETHQLELRRSLDRQNASHKKLIMQVEDAMKGELSSIETRIATIDKESRRKMYGLKLVLKAWMGDGVIK